MKKKTYKIALKSGLSCCDFRAETLDQVHSKIQTGLYGIESHRGKPREIITEENIEAIEELKKG